MRVIFALLVLCAPALAQTPDHDLYNQLMNEYEAKYITVDALDRQAKDPAFAEERLALIKRIQEVKAKLAAPVPLPPGRP